MNEQHETGLQFEIWLELLLKKLGQHNVERNTFYKKPSGSYRQADLTYDFIRENKPHLVLVEAKYCSNGKIKYTLRGKEKHKEEQQIKTIENLVDEVYERQVFIKAKKSFIVTNKFFDTKMRIYASDRKINLIDYHQLQRMYSSLGFKGDINESITSINVDKYIRKPNIKRIY